MEENKQKVFKMDMLVLQPCIKRGNTKKTPPKTMRGYFYLWASVFKHEVQFPFSVD